VKKEAIPVYFAFDFRRSSIEKKKKAEKELWDTRSM